MAALTFKGLLPPATGAIRAAPRAMRMWSRARNGSAWITCPTWGLAGEKPPTNEIRQSNQLIDFSPQELAATFLDRVNAGGDSEMAAAAFYDFAVGGRF
jgi:hypothetical protein